MGRDSGTADRVVIAEDWGERGSRGEEWECGVEEQVDGRGGTKGFGDEGKEGGADAIEADGE